MGEALITRRGGIGQNGLVFPLYRDTEITNIPNSSSTSSVYMVDVPSGETKSGTDAFTNITSANELVSALIVFCQNGKKADYYKVAVLVTPEKPVTVEFTEGFEVTIEIKEPNSNTSYWYYKFTAVNSTETTQSWWLRYCNQYVEYRAAE